ncbi:hypothetical protein [Gayadomonas joobiniege]|uniref:hypothetical protein n=1 Tax=Gayadomonas joobiniege TaxID=1234606 RepID=UPI00037AAF44|nr:hypothetical protein [Gayadomonas joobiniege]
MKKMLAATALSIALLSCGGNGNSEEKTDQISTQDIEQIKTMLANLGYSNFSNFSQSQKSDLEITLKNEGFSSSDISNIFSALGITTAILDDQMLGIWVNDLNDTYLTLGRNSLVVYSVDGANCYHASSYKISTQADNRLILTDIKSNSQSQSNFDFVNFQLKANIPGVDSELYNSTNMFPNNTIGCYPDHPFEIEVEFRELPDLIRSSNRAFYYRIWFDINRNNKNDVGDLFVQLKEDRTPFADFQALENEDAKVWISLEKELNLMSARTSPVNAYTINQNGNTLKFSLDASKASLIELIDDSTPFYLETKLRYSNPERNPYANATLNDEGPWLWASDSLEHTDRYPEEGYIATGDGTNHQDNLNDQSGESGWIDIKSIKFSFNSN